MRFEKDANELRYQMKMLINIAQNENADEYGME